MFWNREEVSIASVERKVDDMVEAIRVVTTTFGEAHKLVDTALREYGEKKEGGKPFSNLDMLRTYAENIRFLNGFSNAVYGLASITLLLQKDRRHLDNLMQREISQLNDMLYTRTNMSEDFENALIKTIHELIRQREILNEASSFSDDYNVTISWKDSQKAEKEMVDECKTT